MNQPSNLSSEITSVNRHQAWIAALLVFGALVATLMFAIVYALQTGIPLVTLPIPLFGVAVFFWGVGLVLMWRGHFQMGVHLALFVLMVVTPLTSLWLAERGLIFGIGVGFCIVFVATLALPSSQAQWFIVLGVFTGLATIALDVYGVPNRYTFAFSQIGGAFIVAVLAVAFALFVILNFSLYPLRIKLLLTFVLVAILSVAGVTFVASRAIHDSLAERSAEDLKNQARIAALAVGLAMDRNVDRLETLSLNKNVQETVTALNDTLQDMPNHDTLIQQNSERWASANTDEAVIRNALNGQLTYSLRQFREVFPGNQNIFITDGFGSIVAATDWQPTYNYSGERWWQFAYNGARGSVYIGQPEFDPMLDAYGIRIALPIYALGRERAVGVVHSVFALTALQRALLVSSFGETGKVDLLFPQGQILTPEGTFRSLSPEEFLAVQDAISFVLPTLTYRGEPLVSGQGVVGVSDEQPEPYLRSRAWRTIATVKAEEAFAIANAGTRAATLAGLVAVGIALFAALLLAGFLTRPIRQLTGVAEQVQGGDLSARALVTSGDEIGTLAHSFNNMTARLQDTLIGLEQRVADRTHELTHANLALQSSTAYLSALSDLSSGLFQRLDVNELLQTIVERAGALVGTQHGFVFLQQPGEDDIEMRVGTGLYDDLIGTHAQRGIGLAGTVWQSGTPMIIENYQKWEGRLPGTRRDALRAIVGVPLKRGAQSSAPLSGDTVGVIGLAYTEEGRTFGKTEVDILQRFSQLAAIALDNAQLYSTSEKRVQELAALNSVSHLVTSESDPKRLIEKAGDQVCRIFGTDFAYVALHDAATNTIEFPYVMDEGKRVEIARLPMGQGLTSQVIHTRQPMLLNAMEASDYNQLGAVDTGDGVVPASLLSVPILSGEQVLGVLSVQRSGAGHPFTTEDERLLSTLAASVGVGIDNARLYANLETRVQELALLNQVGEMVTSELPLTERLVQAGEALRQFFRVPSLYISLYDPAAHVLHTPYCYREGRQTQVAPVPDTRSGFAFTMLQSRAPLLINEQLREQMQQADAPAFEEVTAAAFLGAPILYGNDVVGVVGLSDANPARFDDTDLQLLTTLAATLGSAIQNARLFEGTQSALAQSDALYQVVRDISAARDAQGVLGALARGVHLPFINRIVFFELEQDAAGEIVSGVVAGNWYSGEGNPPPSAGARYETAQLARIKKFFGVSTLLIDEIGAEARLGLEAREIAYLLRATTVVSIPLLVGARLVGTLFLEGDAPHAWREDEVEPLVSIAGAVAVAVNNFRLLSETRAALAETQRLAARERESAEQVMALNRRLTREGWKEFLGAGTGEWVVQAQAESQLHHAAEESAGNGKGERLEDSLAADETKWVTVPIVLRGEVIGQVELEVEPGAHEWSQDQQELVNDVAETLGLALDNVRLYSQMEAALAETRRTAEREKLTAAIADRIYAATDVNTILRIATEELRRTTGADRAVVKLNREKGGAQGS
ncbi:MAG: GAF domain-containing protein [Chloroflexi bacterium]|nr:GAF domain-containing protein [Chloroflexota bacterium]